MVQTILQRVKKSLKMYHMENSEIVFEGEEENPMIEEFIQENMDSILCLIEPSESETPKILKKYESCIVEMTKFDYVTIGGEYQSRHSENGTSRVWNSKAEILDYYKVKSSWKAKAAAIG